MAAKKPRPRRSAPAAKRRGRPPKHGGRLPQVEVQRAYRARLKAAGKVVKVVDASPASPSASAALSVAADFDPATQMICDREYFEGIAEKLRNALSKIERREQELERLTKRNAYLEGELKQEEQHHTIALKEIVTLKQQLSKRR